MTEMPNVITNQSASNNSHGDEEVNQEPMRMETVPEIVLPLATQLTQQSPKIQENDADVSPQQNVSQNSSEFNDKATSLHSLPSEKLTPAPQEESVRLPSSPDPPPPPPPSPPLPPSTAPPQEPSSPSPPQPQSQSQLSIPSPSKSSSSPAPSSPSTPPALPSKRKSPWREPRDIPGVVERRDHDNNNNNTNNNTNNNNIIKNKQPKQTRKRKLHHYWLQDSIQIQIPLNVSADLGQAVKQSRIKRIAALQEFFPVLKKKKQIPSSNGDDNDKDDDDDDDGEQEKKSPKDKKQTNSNKKKNIPQRHEFASIVDYLEAKYVQGVMIDEDDIMNQGSDGDDNNAKNDDASEGQGSVYSETSFLDDTDLQRTVAEQVLAHTTTTKLELEEDDNEFFVNVGALEVEETDLTQDHYDPLNDTKNAKKPKKKRKKSVDSKGKAENGNAKGKNGKSAKNDNDDDNNNETTTSPPKKKTKKQMNAGSMNESPGNASKEDSIHPESMRHNPMHGKVLSLKRKVDKLYGVLQNMIKQCTAEELPRRKTKERVAIKCPLDKGPGDSIFFSNPHVPGQKLKAKIPKNTRPGETFKVTVPVSNPSDDDDTDHNKLSRDFYEALDEYARAFDDWCDADGAYHKELGDYKVGSLTEKRKKFDKLVAEFPTDLKTPVDKAYLQKLIRRIRQSKHKRVVAQAKLRAKEESESGSQAPTPEKLSSSAVSATPKTFTVLVPQLMNEFPTIEFDQNDFDL